jgi:PAT family beta-lactamase induction signal transducer AmpG
MVRAPPTGGQGRGRVRANEEPKVAERAKNKIAWTASSYLGEGLPWTFMHQVATEFLTAIRAPLEQIGYTSLLHLGTTLKFAWSPLVDLVSSKRTWILVTQAAMSAVMLAVAVAAWSAHLGAFWVLLAAMSVLSAAHDIACDGFYMAALDRGEQALYSGVRVAAFRAAMIVGSSGLVYLAGRTSWLAGFGLAGVLLALVAAVNARLLPRPAEPPRAAPADRATRAPGATPERPARAWDRLAGSAFVAAYRSFLGQPQAVRVLAFMLFYKLGDILMFAMSKPLLRDLGVTTSQRGVLNGFGTAVTITGSILGGALIARLGLGRCLVPMTWFQNLAIPLYWLLAVARPGLAGVAAVVMVEQFAAGVGSAAHVVFLMQRCRKAFSASHYAFATAVVALSSTLSGAVSGHLAKHLGLPTYFFVAFLASAPALALVHFVPRTPIEAEPRPAPEARPGGAAGQPPGEGIGRK